jgi:hypothetical protein
VFGDATYLPKNRIQGVLKRAIETISLRRTQLCEVRLDSLPGIVFRGRAVGAEILRHIIACQNCPRDVVGSHVAKL